MKGKKGDMEIPYSFLMYLVFAIAVFLFLLVFIRDSASGTLVKQQVLSKEIALLIDAAPAGTELAIEKGNFSVSVKNGIVEVNAYDLMSYPYQYSLIYPREIEVSEKDFRAVIKVFK